MGLDCGDAEKFLEKIILNKNLVYMGFNKIIMPSNFVISKEVVDETTSIKIINEALQNIKHLANLISKEEKFEVNKKEKHGYFYSSILNYGFNKYFKTSKYFKVDNDACLKCSKCFEVCPLNNILMLNDTITFNNNCMFCLSCINHCPINAIIYKNNKNGTYLCPIGHFKTK